VDDWREAVGREGRRWTSNVFFFAFCFKTKEKMKINEDLCLNKEIRNSYLLKADCLSPFLFW
jgi:hypothetical protein